eukprot:NODE_3264_length_2064_cov_2.716572.p1 GENE.NODE_3264_length_2064_cov_2.716572~~NODE_3264_length_2064_cov_2.716572.p1  ORF type:complete len:396 (-),score=95.13 NODE_3264_length_2064_cov_2.716572:582-1769(-)
MTKVKQVSSIADATPFHGLPVDGGDTKVTCESWRAALRACGAVITAVDLVSSGKARNAFCAVRPPGHHLGPSGACTRRDLDDDPEGSQGFCLLNNAAIGAAYARCVHRGTIRKVAIVDFDVHHGNGTEAVVRNLRQKPMRTVAPKTMFLRGVTAEITVSAPPSCKPWLEPESDAEDVFFASIHLCGGDFFPGTGAECQELKPNVINVALQLDSTSADFRAGLRDRIIPQLLAFDPDMIFISAGFDGHEDDLIGRCRCVEEDYVWATQQLLSVANRCCQGRVVSVLEGGYNTRAGTLSPFAQCVACHVQTLMHTSPNYRHPELERCSDGSLEEADRRWFSSHLSARRARLRRRCEASPSNDDGDSLEQRAKTRRTAKDFMQLFSALAGVEKPENMA